MLVRLVRQVPAVEHEILAQRLDDAFAAQQLAAEHVRQHAAVVVQVDGEQFSLQEKDSREYITELNKYTIFRECRFITECFVFGVLLFESEVYEGGSINP